MTWDGSRILEETIEGLAGGKNIIVSKGGTRSGKTWSNLQFLYAYVTRLNHREVISVVSESLPHLKRGCIRDFKTMLENAGVWEADRWNATDKIYSFSNGSIIEFFGADSSGKVHGAQRDVLFVNECNHISWEIYRQLAIRTKKYIILDYNPTSRFWVDDNILPKSNAQLIHSTYKDNKYLSATQVAEIESNKGDANWWRVYGLGETGSTEGLIYSNWDIIEDFPTTFKRLLVGIDFGFTNDPTAIVSVALSGGELYIDEIAYLKGLDNAKIARLLMNAGFSSSTSIVCDSAEPKSIAEINAYGLAAVPVRKTPDSINSGIQILQRYKMHVTKRSVGIIEELRNYSWKQDINGRWLNVPRDMYNHALDAVRYVALTYLMAAPAPHKARIKVTTGNYW